MNNLTTIENRLKIIHELLKHDTTVQELSYILGIRTCNISKHLKILEVNELVKKRQDGRHRIYYVTDNLKSRLSGDNQVLDLGCCQLVFGNSIK